MRKTLLFFALLLAFNPDSPQAQIMFDAPDTVCINQPVRITNNISNAKNYYWGFCSGYLRSNPTGGSIGAGFGLNDPGAVEVVKDGDNYYGFIVNRGSSDLLRLDFGTSLSNTPAVTNLGTLNNSVPVSASALSVVRDSAGQWFLFITGGTDATNASFARFEFGTDITRIPNSINYANPGNLMHQPRGLVIQEDSSNWFGYMVDQSTDELLMVLMGNRPDGTPQFVSLGNVGSLSGPSDMALTRDRNNWYFMVTNSNSSTISMITTGNFLGNAPQGVNVGTMGNKLFNPSHVTIAKDCGVTVAFITNQLNNNLTRLDIPSFTGLYSATLLGVVSDISAPGGMSRIVRDHDTLYSFIPNGNNTLSRLLFAQCTDASITSSTSDTPPEYSYANPGTYNIYMVINEGLPDMQVECQQIEVLPPPPLTISPDTVLCQGDRLPLFIQGYRAYSYVWSPNYNISDTQGMHPTVWPEYGLPYNIRIYFTNGCIWDTSIHIEVSKVKADAGPDRYLTDGSRTILGGPFTSTEFGTYAYKWTPNLYIDNPNIPNPQVTPPSTMTYYLEVTELNDTLNCVGRDTVIVSVSCANLVLPNAFTPDGSISGSATFGLLNRQIVKLNFFRIYDRWGHLVFTTTDPAKQWDGKVNGNLVPPGVYVWEADGFCFNGDRVQKQGNVTLLR